MCYAPTEKRDIFYNQLQSTLDRIAAGDTNILMGNINVKVGEYSLGNGEVFGKHGFATRNNNGIRFVNCCQRYGIVTGGNIFPHKTMHKGTWRSLTDVLVSQIYLITISKQHSGFFLDVRALRGSEIGLSDPWS